MKKPTRPRRFTYTARHSCNACGKVYRHHQSLKRHSASHVVKQVKCDMCDRMFSTKKHLTTHTTNVHLRSKVVCQMCEKYVPAQYIKRHKECSPTRNISMGDDPFIIDALIFFIVFKKNVFDIAKKLNLLII